MGRTVTAEERIDQLVTRLLNEHDPATAAPAAWWGAQYDLGLAWVNFPPGHGGIGAARAC